MDIREKKSHYITITFLKITKNVYVFFWLGERWRRFRSAHL